MLFPSSFSTDQAKSQATNTFHQLHSKWFIWGLGSCLPYWWLRNIDWNRAIQNQPCPLGSHFNGFYCLFVCDANQTNAINSKDAVTNGHSAIQVSRSIQLERLNIDSTKLDTSVNSSLTKRKIFSYKQNNLKSNKHCKASKQPRNKNQAVWRCICSIMTPKNKYLEKSGSLSWCSRSWATSRLFKARL